jgi:hypothetical protein
MPEEVKKDEPMVDIDSSGPDAEVELQDEANESEAVESTEDTSAEAVATEPQAASDEKQEAETSDEKEAKKEELEDYSKTVQRRIAKLTKKMRDAERERDEALTFAQLQKRKAETLGKKYSTLETESVKDRQTKIQSLLDAQKAKLAQARESGDTNAEVDISKEIARLGYEEAKLAEMSNRPQVQTEETPVETPNYTQYQQPEIKADPKAEEWAAQNRWFGTDKAMTYTAFDLHRTLVDEEGYDPKSDEYYTEINKRIRLEFPNKFDTSNDSKGESTKPVQTVASATRSTKTGRKTIRLTPTEVAIAKKLGVSLEDYAKQKKIMKEV